MQINISFMFKQVSMRYALEFGLDSTYKIFEYDDHILTL